MVNCKTRSHQNKITYGAVTLLSAVEYYELSDDGPLQPKHDVSKFSHIYRVINILCYGRQCFSILLTLLL